MVWWPLSRSIRSPRTWGGLDYRKNALSGDREAFFTNEERLPCRT